MKRYEVFRSRDPQVSFWLQKNGFQNQRSNKDEETIGKITQKSTEKMTKATRTKEVRFESMHGTIRPHSEWKTLRMRSDKVEANKDKERSESKEKTPAIVPSQDFKERDGYEMNEPTENSYRFGNRIKSFSSPLRPGGLDEQVLNIAGRHNITRGNSMLSLSSERPSYIPVLIRNNNTRLRKYNFSDKREVLASERDNPTKKAMFQPNNATPELGNVSQHTTRNINPRRVTKGRFFLHVETIRGSNKYTEKRTDDQLRGEIETFSNPQKTTDIDGNHICINQRRPITGSFSDNNSKDFSFKLYEKDSLQSYSFEMQPKPVKQNYPTSMYSARGNLLLWLGEVNKNNPQLWS